MQQIYGGDHSGGSGHEQSHEGVEQRVPKDKLHTQQAFAWG